MSKRNFILLIIILVIIIGIVFGFLYFQQKGITPGEGEGTNFISQFNPFGNNKPANTGTDTKPADISGYQPEPEENIKLKLTKISSMPVAGFTVYQKERLKDVPVVTPEVIPTEPSQEIPKTEPEKVTTTTKPTPPPTEFMPALRYVDKTTGNIYQTFADKIEEKRFSTTIIPKVHEAFFGNKGEVVIMRYLKENSRTITTFVGNLPKEVLGGDTTIENEVKGSFLPEDVQDISLSSDALNLFYLFNIGDNIVGTTLNLITNKKVQIFDSPFTEWLSSFPNNKTVTLTTKPSFGSLGYMYALDTSNKSFIQVLGNINGLTTLASPNGKMVLYGNSNMSLGIYHTDTKTSDSLGLRTLPEKCTWGKNNDFVYCGVPKAISSGGYPDSWYQGETSFSDQIWKIDITTGMTSMMADLSTLEGGEDIDSIKLALDTNENYLFFVNKKDSYLWELELK